MVGFRSRASHPNNFLAFKNHDDPVKMIGHYNIFIQRNIEKMLDDFTPFLLNGLPNSVQGDRVAVCAAKGKALFVRTDGNKIGKSFSVIKIRHPHSFTLGIHCGFIL
jgi:hypothetical protein